MKTRNIDYHFQQVKLLGFLIAFKILLKYLSMISLLCIPILPPWIYFKSTPEHDSNFFCIHQSLIISLIQLNMILFDLFNVSRSALAFYSQSQFLGFYLMSRSIQLIFDRKQRFKFLVSSLLSYFLSFFSRFQNLLT